jgi:hypothetical protein
MTTLFWLATIGSAAIVVFVLRTLLRRHADRERAAEARAAEFLVQMGAAPRAAAAPSPAPMPMPAPVLGPKPLDTQKLLFDAAHKAGAAGEPALAIQLYARLLARFPDSGFAAEARAAADLQKKKLVKS